MKWTFARELRKRELVFAIRADCKLVAYTIYRTTAEKMCRDLNGWKPGGMTASPR